MLGSLRSRLAVPLAAALTGHNPWAEAERLKALQWETPEALEARALEKLRPLLAHAAEHVPHYRELFRDAGLVPGDIQTIADLARLPVTTRQDLRSGFPQRVVAVNLPASRRRWGSTAGSTGFPLQFFTDRAAGGLAVGSYLFFREWAGAPLGYTLVYIPRPAHGTARAARAAWLRDLAKRALFGERTVHLADFDSSLEELREKLERQPAGQPYLIWGFPSYIARVAAELKESDEELASYPKVVITYAETLSLLNAANIREAFRCPVANHYSSWEVLHLAQTCPDNPTLLHVNSERGILRVVRDDGGAAEPGDTGRVVVTDLTNHVMPFINYEIGDWAIAGERCPCGRGFPTLRGIEGRLGEVVRTPDGRTILPIAICRFLNIAARAHPYIWEYQAEQTAPDKVKFAIVPTPRFTPEYGARLREQLTGFLGSSMQVELELVHRIPVEPSGKRLLVKSRLDAA
jgi:phenylacetate-CoA ligase